MPADTAFGWSRECRLHRESGFGAFRTYGDVRLESAMRTEADVRQLQIMGSRSAGPAREAS
jgi:hypothetical protein